MKIAAPSRSRIFKERKGPKTPASNQSTEMQGISSPYSLDSSRGAEVD